MRVLINGAGMTGLTTALLLADDGHAVTVLERDPAPPPDPARAWERWERRSVGQFRMLHYLQPRWRAVVEAELPPVAAALEDAGAVRYNALDHLPADLVGPVQDGDDELTALTARRPVVEAALAGVAACAPGVRVRRGIPVVGVATGTPTTGAAPHVTGVVTESGDVVRADLVIDASGRRSALRSWLGAAGARPPAEEAENLGYRYFARHFRSVDGSLPALRAPLLQHHGSLSILTLPADDGTWAVGVVTIGHDVGLRGLRDNEAWSRVVGAHPSAAQWLDGEPLDDVTVMATLPDRFRRFVIHGEPIVTGLLAVGDSCASTNPTLGRGVTMGALHAVALRDLLRTDLASQPDKLALGWDDATQATIRPWYDATVAFDRHRVSEIDATIRGRVHEPGDPAWELTKSVMHAAGQDPDVARAYLRVSGMVQTAAEVLGAPGLLDTVVEVGAGWRDAAAAGPDRAALLGLVGR